MTRKEEELVAKWLYRLQKGQKAKDKWRDTFKVDTLDAYWEGDQIPEQWVEDDFIPINLMYANVKSSLDGALTRPLMVHVRPARTLIISPQNFALMDQQAELRQAVVNALLQGNDARRELKKAYLDAWPSMGILKVYYEPVHRPHPFAGRVIPWSVTVPDGEASTYPEKELIGENYVVSRRNPSDILLDPEADSWENMEWIAERVSMTYGEFKKAKLYKNKYDVKVKSITVPEKEEEERRKKGSETITSIPFIGGNSSVSALSSSRDEDEELVYFWEIYDIRLNRLLCITEGNNVLIRDDDTPNGIDGHAYVRVFFTPRRNSPYPIPELWNQLGPQDEYNITRNQIITHRKRFNRQYEVRKGTVSESQMAKFEEGKDGSVIEKNVQERVFMPIEAPPLDRSVYFDVEMLRRDFFDIAGDAVPNESITQIEKTGVANLLNDRMSRHEVGKSNAVREAVIDVVKKLLILVEAEFNLPMAVKMVGEGAENWVAINANMLKKGLGEFLYEVDATSLEPLNPETERVRWTAFMELLLRVPAIGIDQVLMTKTARMYGIYDKALIISLMQMTQRMMQMQLMVGGQPAAPSSNSSTM